MKSHQEQGIVSFFSPSTHRGHHESRSHRKDRTALLQTNPSTAQLLLDRGLGIAGDGLAPWKRFGKQCGSILTEFLEAGPGIGAIGKKTCILMFSNR